MLHQVLLLDPPWKYAGRIPHKPRPDGTRKPRFGEGAEGHYPCMKDQEILAFGPLVRPVMDRNSICFLWATNPKMPLALALLGAMGFRYATVGFTWIKTWKDGRPCRGPGAYTASNPEVVLIGVRGSMPPAVKLCESVIISPRMKHSAKPEAVQDVIERMYPDTRRLELFARRQRPGWDCTGLDLDGVDVREALKARAKEGE